MPSLLFPVAIVALICFNLELEILIPCFPEFVDYFSVASENIPLVVSLNMLGFCVASPFWSAFVPVWGIRKVSLLGTGLFALGSLGCLLSRNFTLFLTFRFFQGLGASAGIICAFIIATRAPQEQISNRLGLMSGISTIALAAGPLVGNFLLDVGGARANQIFLLTLAIIVLVLQFLALPEEDLSDRKMPEFRMIIRGYLSCLFIPGFTLRLIAKDILVAAYLIYLGWSAFIIREEWGMSIPEYTLLQFSLVVTYAVMNLGMGQLNKLFSARSIHISIFGIMLVSVSLIIGSKFMPESVKMTGFLSVWLYTLACAPGINLLMTKSYGEVRDNREYGTGLMSIIRYAVPAMLISVVSAFFEPSWESWEVVFPALLGFAGFCLLVITGLQKVGNPPRPSVSES